MVQASINEHGEVTIFSLYDSNAIFLAAFYCARAANELQKLHNFHEMERKKFDVKFLTSQRSTPVDAKNVNGLLKCHYFMCHTDLLIDYWLLSFVSLTERGKIQGKRSAETLQPVMGLREIECEKFPSLHSTFCRNEFRARFAIMRDGNKTLIEPISQTFLLAAAASLSEICYSLYRMKKQ